MKRSKSRRSIHCYRLTKSISSALFFFLALIKDNGSCAWSYHSTNKRSHALVVASDSRSCTTACRRSFLAGGLATASIASISTSQQASAAAGVAGLAEKLSKRDASVLTNSVFNLPPPAQVYPKFMRGSWDVRMSKE